MPEWDSNPRSQERAKTVLALNRAATAIGELEFVNLPSCIRIPLKAKVEKQSYRLEIGEYCRIDPLRRPRGILYPQKFALTSPASGGRSVDVVRSRTQATQFFLIPVTGRRGTHIF
jgi:hypothetical protein